jgi:hypothetical protein
MLIDTYFAVLVYPCNQERFVAKVTADIDKYRATAPDYRTGFWQQQGDEAIRSQFMPIRYNTLVGCIDIYVLSDQLRAGDGTHLGEKLGGAVEWSRTTDLLITNQFSEGEASCCFFARAGLVLVTILRPCSRKIARGTVQVVTKNLASHTTSGIETSPVGRQSPRPTLKRLHQRKTVGCAGKSCPSMRLRLHRPMPALAASY